MSGPVKQHVSGIFLHVSDLDRSADWYADLLGVELRAQDRFPHIHVFELDNGTHLLLDAKGFTPRIDGSVLFMFDTDDVDAARARAVEAGASIVREIEHAGPCPSSTSSIPTATS